MAIIENEAELENFLVESIKLIEPIRDQFMCNYKHYKRTMNKKVR